MKVGIWPRVREGWHRLARRPESPGKATATAAKPVIGLALGGGFARGLAHIGVLRVLEENRIPIHLMAGTSAGAILAATYAGGRSVAAMAAGARSLRFRDLAGWTLSRMGLSTTERLASFLQKTLPVTEFEKLRIPLTVVTTDLVSGEPVLFRSGDLVAAARASCAYPGLFAPVEMDGRSLIDGAFSSPVPVEVLLEMGATHTIAVHVGGPQRDRKPGNVFQVINQCFALMQERAGQEWRSRADIIIEPNLKEFRWDDFSQAAKLIAAGEAATRQALPAIHRMLLTAQRPAARRASLPQPELA